MSERFHFGGQMLESRAAKNFPVILGNVFPKCVLVSYVVWETVNTQHTNIQLGNFFNPQKGLNWLSMYI